MHFKIFKGCNGIFNIVQEYASLVLRQVNFRHLAPAFARISSNGSLTAHQVQTQYAKPFARYGKQVCTCAHADATHPTYGKLVSIVCVPSHTQNLNATPPPPAIFEIWKRGVHVRTCRCTPPQTCGNTYLMGP